MEITTGKYTIRSDRYQFWIEETRKKTGKKRKKEDEETTNRVTGYYSNIEDLLEDFINKKLLSSEAKTVEQVLREISIAERDAKRLAKGLLKVRKEPNARCAKEQ